MEYVKDLLQQFLLEVKHTQFQLLGLSLHEKNDQKKAKKSITSDAINKIIPNFKPFLT